MVDEEFSAALKAFREFERQWRDDPARRAGEKVLTVGERILEKFGAERGEELLTRINALRREANSVNDPGGPIGNFIDNMSAWKKTHPEVDPFELNMLTNPIVAMHAH